MRVPLQFSRLGTLLSLGLIVCAACSKPAEVRTTKVIRSSVEATVSGVSSGSVRSEQIAELAFGTVGRVRVLNVKLGDSVKTNQVLAEVENSDLTARLAFAREELERSRKLSLDNAMSRSNLSQAQSEYEAGLTALEKSIIRAPCDGIVAELNLEVGQLSQITAVIPKAPIRVVDTKPRFVRAEIDELDMPRVQVGMPARVKILAVRREPFVGTVRKVVPFVSDLKEQDRTTEIELTVESEGIMLPVGASADIEIITDKRNDVLTVTSRALLGRGSERHVFVYKDGEAQLRNVSLGIFNYLSSEITAGLEQDEIVILPSDKVDLQPGLKVKIVGEKP